MWAITVLSVVGVILNIYKRKECFLVWAVTNATWAVYDWRLGAYEQSALFGLYFGLALWGLYQWKKDIPLSMGDRVMDKHCVSGIITNIFTETGQIQVQQKPNVWCTYDSHKQLRRL